MTGMKKFIIAIEEMISEEFEVEAETAEEAMEMAKHKYDIGEYVLSPGNLAAKQMSVVSPDNEATEWVEF